MKIIYNTITDLVGSTPLLRATRFQEQNQLNVDLIVKLEYLNPTGSVKDRLAKALIEDGEVRGILKEGSTIIEPTSGNTGIGLASQAAAKGYRCILVMPDTMTIERRNILKAYGAEIELTPGEFGMKGAIARAHEMLSEIEGSCIPGQFTNPINGCAHRSTTAMEIWKDTEGSVDIVVATVGTGGTISGVGRALKGLRKDIQIIAVEPAASPVLSGGKPGKHDIQGIGTGFIPDTLDTRSYDEVIPVSDEDSYLCAREIARCEGVLVGVSSGSALHAAKIVAARPENAGKRMVVILPDSADRYFSTPLFG